jgi:methylated-DNA-[protein]-cysteine S-methyltransferase
LRASFSIDAALATLLCRFGEREMATTAYCLFETPLGWCAVAWRGPRIAGVELPSPTRGATQRRVAARFPEALERAPRGVARATVVGIARMLRGQAQDFNNIELDFDAVPDFHRKVYCAAREVPAGTTISYGELAKRVARPRAARAVGQAMGRNPFPILVPCHRVLATGGRPGGFSAPGGIAHKMHLLALEQRAPSQLIPEASPRMEIFAFPIAHALANLARRDRTLARLIARVGEFGMRREASTNAFTALTRAIVYQQLNGRAAASILARVEALFPRGARGMSARHCAMIDDADFLAAGLSRNKLRALRDLAARCEDGTVPSWRVLETMTDEAIIERLTTVRGIGRWTVEMLLMFRLARPDVLPVDDFGVRKGFMLAYRKSSMPRPRDLARYGQRWAPYRTIASWYLWRAAELLDR